MSDETSTCGFWRSPQMGILILILLLIIGLLIIPFCLYGGLLQWDMPGHFFSAWFISEYLFPRWTGWNPYFFAGFPQGTFYPPLFHWLCACLGKLIGLKTAFKLLVSLSVVGLAPSLYYAYRSARLNASQALAGVSLALGLLAAPLVYSGANNAIGVTLFSTFNIGLVANAFAINFFLIYVGLTLNSSRGGRQTAQGVVLACVVLSHLLTGLAAVLFALVTCACAIRDKERLRALLYSGMLAATLSAFWWVPFLESIKFAESYKLGLSLGVASYLIIFAGLCFAYNLKQQAVPRCHVALYWYFVVCAVVVLGLNLIQVNVHVYRFVLFPILFFPALLALQFTETKQLRALAIAGLLLVIYGLCFDHGLFSSVDAVGPQAADYSIIPPKSGNGRDLILSSGLANPSQHVAQQLIPMNSRRFATKGLFVESSLNASYLQGLELLLDPGALVWGVPIRLPKLFDELELKALAFKLMRVYGIDRILSTQYVSLMRKENWQEIGTLRNTAPAIRLPSQPNNFVRLEARPRYAVRLGDRRIVLVRQEQDGALLRAVTLDRLAKGAIHLILQGEELWLKPVDDVTWEILPVYTPPNGPLEARESLDTIMRLTSPRDPHDKLVLQRAESELRTVIDTYSQMTGLNEFDGALSINGRIDSENMVRRPLASASFAPEAVSMRALDLAASPIVSIESFEPYQDFGGNWDLAVSRWLASPGDAVVTEAPTELPPPQGAVIVPNSLEFGIERIKFSVRSAEPAPILVRVSYFPKWKAYQEGKEIPIYRAAPNLIAIIGNGDIVLSYQRSWLELFAIYVSTLAAALTVVFAFGGSLVRKRSA